MININRKISCLLFFLALILFANKSAHAQYEVINAKTLSNENINTNEKYEEIPTYNDPELPNFTQEESISGILEKKFQNYRNKKKIQKNKTISQDETLEEEENSEQQPLSYNRYIENQEVDEKNKFQVNADKITYDDEDGNVYAKGNVEIIAKAQGVVLKADEAVLDKPSQTLKLYNNVKVIKNGVEMCGEYLLVDLNEENVLMDNPTIKAYSFAIKAQEGYLIANDFQVLNGTLKSERKQEIVLESSGFQRYENVAVDYIKHRNITRSTSGAATGRQTYQINAKEIVLTSYKDHNSILLKNSDVYYNKHKIVNNSDIEIISDKQNQVIETNTPEAGTLRSFGTYIGYGFAFKLPQGQTLKLMPALTYGDNNIGVGIIGRYRTRNARIEAGYATSTTNLVVRGQYKLSDNLRLRYGRNAYIPEGFMGTRRSGYAAQLEYKKTYQIKDLDARFSNGVYVGFFSEYQKHDLEKAYSTMRFRYMADFRKKILAYENKEQDLSISLNALAQGMATLYGSGQTNAVARIGPILTTKLKCWESSIGYLFAGIHGDSPFVFDKYRYGKSSILLNEQLHIGDKFAIGYRANVSPMKDNYEDKLLTESRFYAIFGPQDLKFVVSYDFVRDIANANIMFILGTDSTKIDFDKLITKNIDGSNQKRDFYKYAKPVKIEKPENI